jgi:hypothetical protein
LKNHSGLFDRRQGLNIRVQHQGSTLGFNNRFQQRGGSSLGCYIIGSTDQHGFNLAFYTTLKKVVSGRPIAMAYFYTWNAYKWHPERVVV